MKNINQFESRTMTRSHCIRLFVVIGFLCFLTLIAILAAIFIPPVKGGGGVGGEQLTNSNQTINSNIDSVHGSKFIEQKDDDDNVQVRKRTISIQLPQEFKRFSEQNQNSNSIKELLPPLYTTSHRKNVSRRRKALRTTKQDQKSEIPQDEAKTEQDVKNKHRCTCIRGNGPCGC